MRRTDSLVVGLLTVGALATGCADDQERYCEAIEESQAELSEQAAGGGPAALIEGLATFEELAAEAPSDIRDEWSLLIDRVSALRDALDDAGVDAATYDVARPPAGLADADRERIAQAARDLGSDETQRALADVEQQALDVCQTPLVV